MLHVAHRGHVTHSLLNVTSRGHNHLHHGIAQTRGKIPRRLQDCADSGRPHGILGQRHGDLERMALQTGSGAAG